MREQQLLEEQRRRLQDRPFGRSAWRAAAAVASLFLALGGGLAAKMSRQHQAEKNALEREIALRSAQAQAAQLAFDAEIRALDEKAQRYLREAKTAKDQARILADLQRQKQALEAARPRPPRRTATASQPTAAPPSATFRVLEKPQIDNEPLGGLQDLKSGDF